MAIPASIWGRALSAVLMLPLLILLPLLLVHHFSFLRRSTSGGGHSGVLSSALFLVSVPILLSLIFTVSNPRTPNNVVLQLEEMEMKVAHLESKLEEKTQALSSQSLYLEDERKLIEEMEGKIEFLQDEIFKTKGLVFTKYNRAINQRYIMCGTIGRIPSKDIDDCNTWLTGEMDVSEWTDDELVCPYDSSTLSDFSGVVNDDGWNEEETDEDYMSDTDISSSDEDIFLDDDAEAVEEIEDYKFDDDTFSDDGGDYDTDGDFFSPEDENEGDIDDGYKSNDIAYDDVFSEEETNAVFLDNNWFFGIIGFDVFVRVFLHFIWV